MKKGIGKLRQCKWCGKLAVNVDWKDDICDDCAEFDSREEMLEYRQVMSE